MSTNQYAALRIDAPLETWPAVENAAAMIHVVDRRRRLGMQMLRRLIGRAHMRTAVTMRGRWLIAIAGHAGIAVHAADSEDELLQLHRDVLDLAQCTRGHIELYHFVDRELRARIVGDSREHALRVTPAGGSA